MAIARALPCWPERFYCPDRPLPRGNRLRSPVFFVWAASRYLLTLGLLFGGLAACASSDPDSPNYDPTLTAVRQTFSAPPEEPAADFVAKGARRGEAFPRFAPQLRRATTQMTPGERAMIEAEMAMLRARQVNDSTAEARYRARLEELRRLAREHGPTAQRRIEGTGTSN